MKKILMLTAAVLMFGAVPVLAESHGDGHKGKGKMFEKHDTNGDGVISKDEFLTHATKRFEKEDTNGDGSISKDEAKASHEARREKMKEMRGKHGKDKPKAHEGAPE